MRSRSAFPLPDLSVVFEHDPSVDAAALGDGWAFRGDVRFAGHFGMLFVRIADPWLVRTDDGVLLTIADPDAQDDGPRVPLATVTVEQTGAGEWASTAVALTAQGSELFNSVYPVGDPLDPFLCGFPSARDAPVVGSPRWSVIRVVRPLLPVHLRVGECERLVERHVGGP